MPVQKVYIDNIDGLWPIIKNCRFDEKIGRTRSRFLYRGISNADFSMTTSLRRNCKDQSARLEHSILRNFEKYVADMGENSLIVIEPPTIDQRIMNQFAYFAVIRQKMVHIETFLELCTTHTKKYIISKKIKWEVREMLDKLNANERIVYPGVDGLCMWLSRHYYVT